MEVLDVPSPFCYALPNGFWKEEEFKFSCKSVSPTKSSQQIFVGQEGEKQETYSILQAWDWLRSKGEGEETKGRKTRPIQRKTQRSNCCYPPLKWPVCQVTMIVPITKWAPRPYVASCTRSKVYNTCLTHNTLEILFKLFVCGCYSGCAVASSMMLLLIIKLKQPDIY